MVARLNGYDYPRALRHTADLAEKGLCDGLELMMLCHYYDKKEAVTSAVRECGVEAAVIHCEKEIGTMLSDGAGLAAVGNLSEAEALLRETEALFRLNCAFAETLRIPRMVLHLWGGRQSDSHVDYNIEKLAWLSEIAASSGVRLLIENVPSARTDPRSNWHRLLPHLGEGGLIFDTRFGKLHEQIPETLTDSALAEKIEHIHISDFAGTYREFAALRPILHPGEGSVNFEEVAHLLNGFGYRGTVTLESPVAEEDGGMDVPKLEKTLAYLRKIF